MKNIETYSRNIINEAYTARASDIHIVPREKDAFIHFRIGHALVKEKKSLKKRGMRKAYFSF